MDRPINIQAAQLPASSDEDRMVVTTDSFAVIDGATTHYEVHGPTGGDYADQLATALDDELRSNTARPLKEVLRRAMKRTIVALDLVPSSSIAPSCTVAIVRASKSGVVDVLVLGDSAVAFGLKDGSVNVLSDTRLDELNLPASREYRTRLREGSGYDPTHRALLSDLQRDQARRRNREGGYWIASTDLSATEHAITVSLPIEELRWVAAATDGAADSIESAGITWEEIGTADSSRIAHLLEQCHNWEQYEDPDGAIRPRSKRHDDKTIAAFRTA
ncbi:protein phosphatase 2C domain-containing protein [Nocardia sp. NPDC004123]